MLSAGGTTRKSLHKVIKLCFLCSNLRGLICRSTNLGRRSSFHPEQQHKTKKMFLGWEMNVWTPSAGWLSRKLQTLKYLRTGFLLLLGLILVYRWDMERDIRDKNISFGFTGTLTKLICSLVLQQQNNRLMTWCFVSAVIRSYIFLLTYYKDVTLWGNSSNFSSTTTNKSGTKILTNCSKMFAICQYIRS